MTPGSIQWQVEAYRLFDTIRRADCAGILPSRAALVRGIWRRCWIAGRKPEAREFRRAMARSLFAERERIARLGQPVPVHVAAG
jgi:hypothetical protein